MYKLIFFSDSYKHFDEAIKEYEKRLWKELEIVKLKPSKRKNQWEIIEEETDVLKEKLEKIKGYKILLYIDGKILSTHELHHLVEKNKQHFWDIIFIIWWAYGVNIEKISHLVDFKLSFSPMTFPHSLAYLMLLEQIYRIEMIKKWTGYHH